MTGHSIPRRRWSDDEIIAALQKWAKKHGRPPTISEWRPPDRGRPSASQVVNRWGTWNVALKKARLSIRKPTNDVSGHIDEDRVCTACLAALIAPILRAWEARHGSEDTSKGRNAWGLSASHSWLINESGLSPRKLTRILKCEFATTGLSDADKLLVEALDRPDLFHTLEIFPFKPRSLGDVKRGTHVCHQFAPGGPVAGSIEPLAGALPSVGGDLSMEEAA